MAALQPRDAASTHTWQSRLEATNYVEECSFTEQWEPKTIFYLHLGDKKKNPKPVEILLFIELDPSLMKAVKQLFPLLNPSAICMSPPMLFFPLLCDSSQVHVPFSSAALTAKNENKAKKLCNTKGEGSKILSISETSSQKNIYYRSTLATATPSPLSRDVHSPIHSGRQKQVRLAGRIHPHHCISICTASHYLTSSQSSLRMPQHSPLA